MDGAAPPQSPWPDTPTVLPGGGETLARCEHCGEGFIPASRRHRHCSTRCRERSRATTPARKAGDTRRSERSYLANVSYRLARRALRRAGMDPACPAAEALRGRGVVDGWRELVGLPPEHRGRPAPSASDGCPHCGGTSSRPGQWCCAKRRRLARGLPVREQPAKPKRAPWGAPVGEQPEHVAWGVALDGIPGSAPARLVHGLVSRLVAEGHTQVARWALAMPTGAHGSGWGVVCFRDEDAARLAGRAERVRVGAVEHDLRTGPVIRLRAPALPTRGKHRVTVDAVTPVSHLVDGRSRAITTPTVETILGALGDVSQRLGLSVGRMHVASVETQTVAERVTLGGHMGSVPGWVGRIVVECNAPAAWLLLCARHAGLGGRVAFGMGRVRVEVKPWS